MPNKSLELLFVKRVIVPDDDRSFSHLGEFRRPRRGEVFVLRATGELRDPCGEVLAKDPDGGIFIGRGCFEDFIPANLHCSGPAPACEEEYQHALQDWRRAEALNDGDFYMVGVTVKAGVKFPSGVIHEFVSPGLWGVESDSEEACLREIALEELAGLMSDMEVLGFSKEEVLEKFEEPAGE